MSRALWMDGWTDGQMDGQMDGWMGGWMGKWVYGRMKSFINVLKDLA